MQSAWAVWAPPQEKSYLISIQISGTNIGLLLTMFVGGVICQEMGWEALFYVTGESSYPLFGIFLLLTVKDI